MARSEGRIHTAIWNDDAFVALPAAAQRMYFVLLSQPGLSWCGVLPYRPRRWAKYAPDTTDAAVKRSVAKLAESRHIVLDLDTEEAMVRTLVKHDGVLDQPNMVVAMAHDFLVIDSHQIKEALLEQLPEDFPSWITARFQKGLRKGLPEGFLKAYGEWVSRRDAERVSVPRVRAGARAPSPTPNPQPPTGDNGKPAATPPVSEALLREWYDGRTPKPVLPKNAWPGMRSVVQKALDNGHPPDAVRAALAECDVVSAGWLEPRLRKVAEATKPATFEAQAVRYR